jgi:hypothetical protein
MFTSLVIYLPYNLQKGTRLKKKKNAFGGWGLWGKTARERGGIAFKDTFLVLGKVLNRNIYWTNLQRGNELA